jgi:hypothetical protein
MAGLSRAVAVLVGAAAMLVACGGEQRAPSRPSVGVTTVTTESRAGHDAAIAVCRQVISSAGVMVRDYNAFVVRLNETQDYAQIDKEDRYARDTLDTGAELIRKSLTPAVPDDLEQRVQAFLTATEQLSEQIGDKRKLALNKATDQWSDRRSELIDACGEFMPTGAG